MSITAHRRIPHPGQLGGYYQIECTCGWLGKRPITDEAMYAADEREKTLNKLFVDHVPPGERHNYVLVDARPVPHPLDDEKMTVAGNFLMPAGIPCKFDRHWEEDGMRFVNLVQPAMGKVPVGEIRLEDGRILIAE